jgi:hypothetical protein
MKTPVKAAVSAALPVALSLCAVGAQALDITHRLPIRDVIEMGKTQGKLSNDIKFYFGDQPHPPVAATFKKGIIANKKTHATRDSTAGRVDESILITTTNKNNDEKACNWVMLSALIQMQQAARRQGGNAVINIESYYKKNPYRSNDQFECHAGYAIVGVTLKGDIAKLDH